MFVLLPWKRAVCVAGASCGFGRVLHSPSPFSLVRFVGPERLARVEEFPPSFVSFVDASKVVLLMPENTGATAALFPDCLLATVVLPSSFRSLRCV
jgi:hypothetical protein